MWIRRDVEGFEVKYFNDELKVTKIYVLLTVRLDIFI
jgi:hypothetical protein